MREIFENVPEELVSKTATYDQKVPITSILEAVDRYGAVVITKNNEYIGVVDQRSISKKGALKIEEKFSSGKFAKKVPVVTGNTSIAEVINHFYHSASKALPYMKGKGIAGVIRRDAILKAILSMHLLSKVKVNDIMSTPLIAIDFDATVEQARKALDQYNVNRLVVVTEGRLAGILTPKNIVKFIPKLKGSESRRTLPVREKRTDARVGDICTRNPRTIEHNSAVDEAIRNLIENNISSLVVVRGGKPTGVLTVRDILESVIQQGQKAGAETIMITGLGPNQEEFRSELVDSLGAMAGKIDRFAKMNVEYIALNVKQVKTKGYEMKVRVGLEKRGPIYASVTGFNLERTLKALEDVIYKVIKSEKEMIVTSTREADSTYDREEE